MTYRLVLGGTRSPGSISFRSCIQAKDNRSIYSQASPITHRTARYNCAMSRTVQQPTRAAHCHDLDMSLNGLA